MATRLSRLFRGGLLAAAALALSGCGAGDPDTVQISAAHSLFFASSSLVAVIENTTRNVVIDGEVRELGVVGDLIVGRAVGFGSVQEFYFVLHSDSGSVLTFPGPADADAYVAQLGVGPPPLRAVGAWR